MPIFSQDVLDQHPGVVAFTDTNHVLTYCNPLTNTIIGFKDKEGYKGKLMSEVPCKAADFAEIFVKQEKMVMQQDCTLKVIDIHPCVDNVIFTQLSLRFPLKTNGVISGVITMGDKITRKQLINLSMAISRSDKKYRKGGDLSQRSYEISHSFKNTKLSKRELECLFYIIRGKTSSEISTYLNLSKRTIESYTVNIKYKLNCNSKSELIEMALETHLLDFIPESLLDQQSQMSVIIESF